MWKQTFFISSAARVEFDSYLEIMAIYTDKMGFMQRNLQYIAPCILSVL